VITLRSVHVTISLHKTASHMPLSGLKNINDKQYELPLITSITPSSPTESHFLNDLPHHPPHSPSDHHPAPSAPQTPVYPI
jgi:hypothetical protein